MAHGNIGIRSDRSTTFLTHARINLEQTANECGFALINLLVMIFGKWNAPDRSLLSLTMTDSRALTSPMGFLRNIKYVD